MPKNNELEVVQLPTSLGINDGINTDFVDHLDSIKVKLVSCPPIEELRNYIPDFCKLVTETQKNDFTIKP